MHLAEQWKQYSAAMLAQEREHELLVTEVRLRQDPYIDVEEVGAPWDLEASLGP